MKKYFWKLRTEIYLGLKILLYRGVSRKTPEKGDKHLKIPVGDHKRQ